MILYSVILIFRNNISVFQLTEQLFNISLFFNLIEKNFKIYFLFKIFFCNIVPSKSKNNAT
jgi:hypothetical protein